MNFIRLKKSFSKYSDPNLIDFGNGVIQGLTDNPHFPKIGPALKEFVKAFNKFEASILPRGLRNTMNTAVKNSNREETERQLILLSCLVEYEAKMDETALRSSNFEIANKPKPKGLVGMVKGISMVTNGVEGMMIIQCDIDPNATIYHVRISLDEVNWKWFGANATRKVKITGLPAAERLYVQVRLENAHGHSPWSASKVGIIGTPEVVPSIHE